MPTPVDCICQPNELNPDELQAVNIELYSNKPTILPSTDIDGQPITRLGSESIHPAYDETYRYEIFMPKCYTSVDQTAFDDLLGTLDYYQSQYPEEEIKLYIQFEGSEEYVQAHNLITNELNTKSYFSMKFNCSFSGYGEKHYVNDSNLLMREIFNEVNRPGFEVVGYQGNDTFAEIPECEVLDGKDMPIYNIDNLYLGRKTLKVVDLPNSFDFTFNGTSSEDPIVYLNINQRTSKNECRSNKMVFNYANEYTTTSDGSIYALYKNSSYERVAALCSGSSTLKTLNVPDEVTIGNSSYKVVTVTQNAMRNGSLESVTLGNNVTTLETRAFDNNNISNFTFNNKLETIKEYALDRNNLTEVTLPNCVRRLERCCLPACVTKLTLNDGLKTICAESFANITNLKEVYIPLSVTEMGQFVFKPSNGMVIKVAASSKPDGWHNDWIFPTGVAYEVLYNQTR